MSPLDSDGKVNQGGIAGGGWGHGKLKRGRAGTHGDVGKRLFRSSGMANGHSRLGRLLRQRFFGAQRAASLSVQRKILPLLKRQTEIPIMTAVDAAR